MKTEERFQTMTPEEAITHTPHAPWPNGSPCMCPTCHAARLIRSGLAQETRDEAKRRGYSPSICDRAASFRLNPGMTINSAISMAIERDE